MKNTKTSRGLRGAVMTEYALLLLVFAIPVMAGLVIGGIRMLEGYTTTRDQMLSPFP